eukprot:897279-Rhodomonas_salina.3
MPYQEERRRARVGRYQRTPRGKPDASKLRYDSTITPLLLRTGCAESGTDGMIRDAEASTDLGNAATTTVSGTDLGYATTMVSGTDLGYAARRLRRMGSGSN